ncbi:SDR family NAD(P)-dependent oxidoreductase [Nocardia sp. CA-120079]|uniref:SDR family NAD(P)-dependent oxidoreductase n=1 Tax=Nocardia sp. CA-120079 TaxID=3239974 RepID=UPI003D97CCE2
MANPVAVITGGASGIGLEVARRLANSHRVAILDIDGDAAGRAAELIGDAAIAVECDIVKPKSVSAAIETVLEKFGRIDVAISNAGIGTVGVARHLDPEVLAVQLDVNLTGNWRFIHTCLPHLISSRGYILGVASAAAIMSPPGESFYGASKAGLEALLNTLRTEVAHLGVGVGIAYLMFIDTPMVRDGDREHADLARMRSKLPGAAHKTFRVEVAADLLVRGIRRRARRIFVPRSLRIQHIIRGLLWSVIDRQFGRIAPEVDGLTEAKVLEKGSFAAAFSRGPLAAHQQRSQDSGGSSS